MDAQEGKLPDEEAVFERLMKRLTGKQVTMPENDARKVLRPGTLGDRSIVDVTEELIRQLKK